MERLTKRIPVPKEKRDVIVFTQGEYSDTIPAEMTHEDTRKVLRKLAEYEDAEEQGFLLRLPCKVGDTVYIPIALNNKIYIGVCRGFKTDKYMGRGMLVEIQYEDGDKSWEDFSSFGKTVFLTQAEAEQKLKEMESD